MLVQIDGLARDYLPAFSQCKMWIIKAINYDIDEQDTDVIKGFDEYGVIELSNIKYGITLFKMIRGDISKKYNIPEQTVHRVRETNAIHYEFYEEWGTLRALLSFTLIPILNKSQINLK